LKANGGGPSGPIRLIKKGELASLFFCADYSYTEPAYQYLRYLFHIIAVSRHNPYQTDNTRFIFGCR